MKMARRSLPLDSGRGRRSLTLGPSLALLALAGALLGTASCGVMFGAETGSTLTCGAGTCSSSSDCAAQYCECNDGSSHSVSLCVSSESCCASLADTCSAGCQTYGGWVGSAGSGGYGGSGGFGGYGGSGGFGGSGGSGGQPQVGDPCFDIYELVCGCDVYSCDQILRCVSGYYESVGACSSYETCVQYATGVGCDAGSYLTPYYVEGASCLNFDSYACSPDGATELRCDGSSWNAYQSCYSQGKVCQGTPGGTPTCPSSSGCVGCL